MKRIWIVVIVIIAALGAGWWFHKQKAKKNEVKSPYEFTTVKHGDLLNTVSATGTLEAVGTLAVSTQVSGTVDRVLADYNDVVRKGQVLAILDQKSMKTAYEEAQANLNQAQASLRLAQSDYDTQKQYRDKNLNTEYELLQAEVALTRAQAQVIAAKSSFDKADLNLNTYSIIRSPIDGKILSKAVEEGATVAANFSAPTLFTIARDLSHMEIHASVDESDIGQIREGLKVTYTVEAYPDSEFSGVVREVYLQPEVVSNVVNYTVVVDTSNPHLILLPGMTATCEFVISGKQGIDYIENAVLAITPTVEMLVELKKTWAAMGKSNGKDLKNGRVPSGQRGASTGTEGAQSGQSGAGGMSQGENGQRSEDIKMMYYVDAQDQLRMMPVKVGITDGTNTEITPLRELPSGAKIIKKATGTKADNDGMRSMGPRLL
jgi:HlyD family secretion protein